jgi:uncharacterized protein YlaI
MIKEKTARKQKMKTFLAFGVVSLSLLLAGSIFAQYVPQEIGFKDVKFTSLKKEMCQECHGDSLVEDHHSTSDAVAGNCVVCHGVRTEPGSVGVSLERNCMVCHNESPHHTIEPAKNKECTACHDSPGVSDYSTEVPSYPISSITPTVANCRLCHGEGVVDGEQIVDSRDTHHGISFKECKVCHGKIDLPEEERTDEGSTDIRICERCHNVKALHEVVPHVEENACSVCHGGKTATMQPAVEETEQPESGETEQPEGE